MEENNEEGEGPTVGNSTSSPPYKKICILKIEEESLKKHYEKQKNPLDIPEIIAIVAGHISKVNDIKSVRTESKAWKDETFLKWRNSVVFLINDETIPILVKAFEPTDLTGLSDEDKATTLKEKDPFGLNEAPFKNYRFANSRGGAPWAYPLDKNDFVGKIIWNEAIGPKATYLDLGECVLKKFFYAEIWTDNGVSYLPGIHWILKHCRNVNDLAMAPLQSSSHCHVLNLFDLESDDEEEVTEVRKLLRNEVECQNVERRRMMEGRFTNEDSNRQYYRHVLICNKIEKAFDATRIQSFTISTPQHYCKSITTLNPLMNYEAEEVIQFGNLLFKRMLNLKHLKLPNGAGSTSLITGLNQYQSRHSSSTQLESLTALAAPPHLLIPHALNSFISRARPPLRELRMSLKARLSWCNFVFNDIFSGLRSVQETIEKLEVEVYCEQEEESESVNFSLGITFANLAQFKITLDYEHFQKFNFDLNKMPKLQSFHLGKKVQDSWTDRKLEGTFAGNLGGMNLADEKLTSLEEFHFNGNLIGNALLQVVKMTKLKTFELVLDQENLPALGNICPRLRKLTLLPGSDVPEEVVLSLKKSYQRINIIAKSKEDKCFV